MKGQGQFGIQPPLSPPDLSNKPKDEIQGQTNQGNAQNGLSPEFQNVLNQQNGQNQPIPTPTLVQGGGNVAPIQNGGNNVQNPIDSDAPGAEFGLDVRKMNIKLLKIALNYYLKLNRDCQFYSIFR